LTPRARFTTIAGVSYYPQPYPQPPYGASPAIDYSRFMPPGHDDLLAPARRAGVLMMVLGVLISFMGACNGGSAMLLTPEKMAENQAAMRELGWPDSPIKPETARTMSAVGGGLTLLVGLAFVVTGVYVRRGTPAAVTTGLVLTGGVTLLVGGLFLLFVIGLVVSPVMAGAMLCVLAVPLALLVWLLVWLVGAARNNSRVVYAKQQYQAQFYQYQQAYGGYAGGTPYPPSGYAPVGYAPPPPQPQQQATPSHPAPQQPAPPAAPPPSAFDRPAQPGGPDEPPAPNS
jgi:hypothetical protein